MTTMHEDVVDSLLAQHQQIKLLFAETEKAHGQQKKELFRDLVALLAVHESIEESLVHPLAKDRLDDGGSVVPERLREEQDAKLALSRLYDLGVDSPAFDDGLAELRDAVIEHARAEEVYEFTRLREFVSAERLQRMAPVMKALQAMAPTRPHPGVSPSQTATLLGGPPLAVFDRVRDILRDVKGS
jgi:hemerythrin superfamily protein